MSLYEKNMISYEPLRKKTPKKSTFFLPVPPPPILSWCLCLKATVVVQVREHPFFYIKEPFKIHNILQSFTIVESFRVCVFSTHRSSPIASENSKLPLHWMREDVKTFVFAQLSLSICIENIFQLFLLQL